MSKRLILLIVMVTNLPLLAVTNSPPPAILKTSALFWGGYNRPSSDEFQIYTSGLTEGGVAGGVEFLAGNEYIRAGIATSYISLFAATSDTGVDTKALVPFEGVLNFYFFGFYAGARAGYAVDVGSTTIPKKIYQKTNGTVVGGQLGYQLEFGAVAIDIGVTVNFAHTEATATRGFAGAHADYTNILPRLGVQYAF